MTSLSIIIVNRNTADLLDQSLDHVFCSELDERPEVIVVDNGSIDDSVERVKDKYPEVKIIEAGRNLGFAAANNRGFKLSTGDFLLLINTDAMLEPDCAAKLLRLMSEDPRVGMAGPQLLNNDGSLQTSYESVPTLATECLNRSLLKRLFPKRYPSKYRPLTEAEPVEALIGAVLMIRRKAFEELGGFDEGYFFFLEETDLAVRMQEDGWKVVHEPRARAVHLHGATAKTDEASARIEFYRSRYLFFEKHHGEIASAVLKAVMVVNLTLNVVGLGIVTLFALRKLPSVAARFRIRNQLWRWHLAGCPTGRGLSR